MVIKRNLVITLFFILFLLATKSNAEAEGCAGRANCASQWDNYWIDCDGELVGGSCVVSDTQKAACCSPNPPPIQNPTPTLPPPVLFVSGSPNPPGPGNPQASDPNNSTSTTPLPNDQNPIVNWSRSSVPGEVDESRNSGVLAWIQQAFSWLVFSTVKRDLPSNPDKVYTVVENSQKVTIPQEVQPTPPSLTDPLGILGNFKDFFSPRGLFGNTPFNSENAPDDAERLKASERSWFPDEVKPLTGPTPTPTTR